MNNNYLLTDEELDEEIESRISVAEKLSRKDLELLELSKEKMNRLRQEIYNDQLFTDL